VIRKYSADVHAFDPTPSSVDLIKYKQVSQRFVFHPWAVTNADGTLTFYPRLKKDGSMNEVNFTMIPQEATRDAALDVPGYSLSTICEKLGHSKIDLMKMNIEGAEYEVLEGLLRSPIKPTQLLIEFHHRFPGIGLKKTADMIERLRGDGYMIFAVSATGRSVSFIRQ
jgi:FkbM family methyltransferase